MKRATTITLSLVAVAAALLLAGRLRRSRSSHMRTAIADEGYETAPDILYPGRRRSNDEQYGPVIPA